MLELVENIVKMELIIKQQDLSKKEKLKVASALSIVIEGLLTEGTIKKNIMKVEAGLNMEING